MKLSENQRVNPRRLEKDDRRRRRTAQKGNRTIQSSIRQAIYYNARQGDIPFVVGDRVWKENKVLSKKTKGFTASQAPKYTAL